MPRHRNVAIDSFARISHLGYQIKKVIKTDDFFVEIIGFEPMTSCMPCKRSSQLSYTPIFSLRWRLCEFGLHLLLKIAGANIEMCLACGMRFCLTIRGRVQGVSFRKYVMQLAQELGVCGFVQNQPDGSVYCEAEGDKHKLEIFMDYCGEGPPMAKVTSVEVETKSPVAYSQFEIRK
jgi:acylphosphatase